MADEETESRSISDDSRGKSHRRRRESNHTLSSARCSRRRDDYLARRHRESPQYSTTFQHWSTETRRRWSPQGGARRHHTCLDSRKLALRPLGDRTAHLEASQRVGNSHHSSTSSARMAGVSCGCSLVAFVMVSLGVRQNTCEYCRNFVARDRAGCKRTPTPAADEVEQRHRESRVTSIRRPYLDARGPAQRQSPG